MKICFLNKVCDQVFIVDARINDSRCFLTVKEVSEEFVPVAMFLSYLGT
jgi:hypothetical protein